MSRRKNGNSARSRERGMSQRSKRLLAMAILGCMLSTAILAYNMDEIYISQHHNAMLYAPQAMLSDVDNTLLIMTTDANGDPLANEPVKVYLVSDNRTELLYEGRTGEDGTSQPVIRPRPVNGTAIIEIKAGKETMLRRVRIEDTIKLMISTDKPIYQPGQDVHIRTLAFEGQPAHACARNVTMEIESPAGDVIFRQEYEANNFGIASMDFPLAEILPLGYYKITAFVGTESASRSFLVKRYVLPTFRIDMQDLRSWYTVDEDIDATISCQYFFGKVVKGTVRVTASTYYGVWQEVYSAVGVLVDGKMDLEMPGAQYAIGLPWNSNNGYMVINVTVIDEAGHIEQKSTYVSISRDPIVITALSDLNVRGVNSKYYIVARYPDGMPVPNAQVSYGFSGSNPEFTTTDDRGVGLLEFEYRGQDSLTITVEKDGSSSTESFHLEEHRGIKVIASQPRYEIGDIAQFDIHYSGDSLTSLVYYEVVSKGFVLETGRANIQGGRANVEMAITSSMVPLCEMRVFKVLPDLTITGDRIMFGVGEIDSLDVDITVHEDVYRPRDEVVLDFRVSEGGSGVASALGVSIVDQAVFEVNSKYEGFENLLFEMDADFSTPQFQICDYIFTNKDMTALLTDTTSEISLTTGKDASMTSTWTANLASALEMKDDAVQGYWTVLFLLSLIGYFGLIAMGYKRRALAAIGVAVVIAVPGILSMYTMNLGFGDTGAVDKGMQPGLLEGAAPLGGVDDGLWAFEAPLDNDASDRTTYAPSAESGAHSSPVIVRQFFPETWYWNPSVITDENGHASLTLRAPDSITSWNVEATASTMDARFGLGSDNITIFQDFFIEPDIPVSVVRGDEFPLKILIYNYLNTTSNVTVLLGADDWYNTTDPLARSVDIAPNTVGSVDFDIVAEIVGWHEVNVMASTSILADAVTRRIYVEPDGKEVITTYTGQLEDDDTANISFDLDPLAIQFSSSAVLKLEAGMDSVVLEGAEKYIHFVSGCGEQSMSTLSINILAFDVMEKTSADLELMKYETMVTQGIQHELTFLLEANNGIGRGIVWFPSDRDVHPWLTSWGLITFADAQTAGFALDNAIITDMQDWLVSQQEADGSYKFPDWGIYETNNPILKSKKLASTAYITHALLYSEYDPSASPISNAVDYIIDHHQEAWEDPYTLALCLNVLANAQVQSSLREQMAGQLDTLKNAENGTYYWASDTNMISDSSYRYYGGCNARVIETTSYAMMALHEHGGYFDLVSGAREYLLAHRSNLGGFFSTQDTVVALQSLRACSGQSMNAMDIDVMVGNISVRTVHFDQENAHLAIFVDMKDHLNESIVNTVSVRSTGEGRIYYTLTRSQYLPWWVAGVERPQELSLSVTYDTKQIHVDDSITAHLTMEYLGSASMLKMILIDLRSPAGFAFVTQDLESLVESGKISSYELADRQALLYVTDVVPGDVLQLDYGLRATMPIKGTIQGVKAYDMYDPDLTVELEPVEVQAIEP